MVSAVALAQPVDARQAHDGPVRFLTALADGSVVSADLTGVAVRWRERDAVWARDLGRQMSKSWMTVRVRGLAASHDGRRLFVSAGPRLWSVAVSDGTSDWHYDPPSTFAFIVTGVAGVAVSWDGEVWASLDDGFMEVRDPSGEAMARWQDASAPIALHAHDDRIVGTDGFTMSVWESASRRLVDRRALDQRAFRFAAGRGVAVTRELDGLTVWNIAEARPLRTIALQPGGPGVAVSPDGASFAAADGDGWTVFDRDGAPTHRVHVDGHRILSLAFLGEAGMVATGDNAGRLVFWHLGR
jgi:hypothetical protein